jgi:hypothetical protein
VDSYRPLTLPIEAGGVFAACDTGVGALASFVVACMGLREGNSRLPRALLLGVVTGET